MNDFEKKALRLFVLVAACSSGVAFTFGISFANKTAISIGSVAAAMGVIVAFLWAAQLCLESFRNYGLGEGIEFLYGKDHARHMFGENYKKPPND